MHPAAPEIIAHLEAQGYDLTDKSQRQRNNAALEAEIERRYQQTYRGTPEGAALLAVMGECRKFAKYEEPRVEKRRFAALKDLWWFNGGKQESQRRARATAKQTRLRAGQPARDLIARLCADLLGRGKIITPRELQRLAADRRAVLTEKQIRSHLPAIKKSLDSKSMPS